MAQVIPHGKFIDGDGHVIDSNIKDFLPAPYTGRGKQGVGVRGAFPAPDVLHNEPVHLLPGAHNQSGPKEWAEFLLDVGIETTVLYPSLGLAIGNVSNRDWAIGLCRGYNDWLDATYLKIGKQFQGMALLPMQDPEEAARELRRCVSELGMRGGMMPANGLAANLGAKQFWPVYAEAERLGCALAVHGGGHQKLGLDTLESYPPVHALGHPFGQMISCAGMIFNGVFDRFPGLRVAYLEGGVAWLLLALERFDRSYETHVPYNPRGEMLKLAEGQRVSGYIKSLVDQGRFVVGCEGDEPMIGEAIRQLGAQAFFFSSDYPHEVNAEKCKHEIGEIVAHETLSADQKNLVLRDTAQRFYRL